MKKYIKPEIIEEIIELEDIMTASSQFGATQAGDSISPWSGLFPNS